MKFSQFNQLVFEKVKLNLKAEAKKTYLSYLWWLLEPALFVGTFYLVFAVFMATKTPDFVVFLCCGKIPFLWFSRTVNNSCGAIIGGKGLMNQVSIPKSFFPTVVIFQDLFKSAIVFSLLAVFVALNGFELTLAWLAIPVLMLCQLLFISALAFVVAMIVPFIPDLRFIVGTGILMMMFGSGIFYDYKKVILPEHRDLFLMNPMANLIRSYRDVMLDGVWPDWSSLAIMSTCCALLLVVALLILKRLDPVYPRLVLE